MFYEDFNDEIRSSYARTSSIQSNLSDKSQIPESGLRARTLLDADQLKKLFEIRKRRLKSSNQRSRFIQD